MQKKFIVMLLIAAFITAGIFIFGILGYTTYGYIDESFKYNYSTSGNDIDEITLDTDICDIEIKYNESIIPTNIAMMITIDIHMEGFFMEGKTFSSYFEPIDTVNNSMVKSLTLKRKPSVWFDPSFWFKSGNVKLIATLRTDLKYNISVDVATGNIKLLTSEKSVLDNISLVTKTGNIQVNTADSEFTGNVDFSTITGNINIICDKTNFSNNINVKTATGNVYYNLNECNLGGDLEISISTGNIDLRTNDIISSNSNTWTLSTITGNIDILVQQNIELGSQIQGTTSTKTGNIDLNYVDTNSNVGAKFTGSVATGDISYSSTGGFIQENNSYRSLDFATAFYKYDLNLNTITGNIKITGSSI